MDTGSLLLAVAAVNAAIDRIQQWPTPALRPFPIIKAEMTALEEGLQNLSQWLYNIDQVEQASLRPSLGQVAHTVQAFLDRLLHHLRSNFVDPQLEVLSVGVRECVALIDVTADVCQLPVDLKAQKAANELRIAARLLYSYQAGTVRERRRILKEQHSASQPPGLRLFLSKWSNAEDQLQDGRSVLPNSNQNLPSKLSPTLPRPRSPRDRDGLHMESPSTSGASTASSSRAVHTRSRQLSCPESPRSNTPWSTLRVSNPAAPISSRSHHEVQVKQIARRPVPRSATTPAPASLGDGYLSSPPPPLTLSPVLSQDSNPSRERERSASLSIPARTRLRASSSTRELFSQASQSLDTLTGEVQSPGSTEIDDLPPPYVEPQNTSPLPSYDIKQRHTSSLSIASTARQSLLTLVPDDSGDSIRTLVPRDRKADEGAGLEGRTALMEAADLGHSSAVASLLSSTGQLLMKDANDDSALHIAAQRGYSEICSQLLVAGAQVEDYNRHGDTPIALAARGGHAKAVDILLDYWTTQRGTSVALTRGYMEALRSGNVSTVEAFIMRHIKPKRIKESVLCAAEGGSIPVLDYIMSQKCNMKERSPQGWAAIHFAARNGHIAMVEKLLSLKLGWRPQTKSGETPLHIAVRHGQVATANALIMHKHANVNIKDNDGCCAIHHAARLGELPLMTALLNAGAKLDFTTKFGWDVMHIAAAYGHLSIVADLITRGVSIEDKLAAPDFKPWKKTNEAAHKGYWAEIRWPHPGARPLHLSLEFGHDEVSNVLLAAGAKVDEADSKGWRPLHHAAFSVRPAMVEMLLRRGVSPHDTTNDNNTPLSLGFRGPGLEASEEARIRVWEMLQGSMNATKKSKMKQFSDFMSWSSSSKEADTRNRVWHTAELAAALYDGSNEPDSDSDGEQVADTKDQKTSQAVYDEKDEATESLQGSSTQLAKVSSRSKIRQ